MNLLLDHEQIDERFMNYGVGPVAMFVEQAAEGVLHGAGHGGEHVRLDRRQMDDVLADKPLRNGKPVRVDLLETEKLVNEIAHGLSNGHPFNTRLVEVNVAQAMRLNHAELLVLALAEPGVDHDGSIVAHVDQIRIVPVALHRPDDTLQLPRRRRTAGVEEMPTDVHLERCPHPF